jgi:hypothetical protein
MEIKMFLETINDFSAIHINQENDHENDIKTENSEVVNSQEKQENVDNETKFKKSIGDHKVVQLKNNYILRGLVSLENIFYHNVAMVRPTIHLEEDDVEEININTTASPKLVKISRSLPS